MGQPGQRGQGFLELAFRGSGPKDTWQPQRVCADPPQTGGNREVLSAGLARGPGHHVYTIYSKLPEKYRRLFYRVCEHGRPLGGEILLAESADDGAFEHVTGNRSSRFWSTLCAVVSGRGLVRAVGLRFPAKIHWDE